MIIALMIGVPLFVIYLKANAYRLIFSQPSRQIYSLLSSSSPTTSRSSLFSTHTPLFNKETLSDDNDDKGNSPFNAASYSNAFSFNYPSMINQYLLVNETNMCDNLYEHSCGRWQNGFNRFFGTCLTDNLSVMMRVRDYVMTGRDRAANHLSSSFPLEHKSVEVSDRLRDYYLSCKDRSLERSPLVIKYVDEAMSIINNDSYCFLRKISRLASLGVRSPIGITWKELPYSREMVLKFTENGVHLRTLMQNRHATVNELHKFYGVHYERLPVDIDTDSFINDAIQIQSFLYKAHTDRSPSLTMQTPVIVDTTWKNKRSPYLRKYADFKRIFLGGLSRANIDHIFDSGDVGLPGEQDEIFVSSLEYFIHLDWIIPHFRQEQWKNYMWFTVLYTPLSKLFRGNRNREESCLSHTFNTFPIMQCEAFRGSRVGFEKRQEIAKNVTALIKETFKEMISDPRGDTELWSQNAWCPVQSQSLSKELMDYIDSLHFSYGDCVLIDDDNKITYSSSRHRRYLRDMEMTVVIDPSNYVDNVMRILGHGAYRLYHPDPVEIAEETGEAEEFSFGESEFLEPNAMYDPVHHRIIILPGMLQPPATSELYDMLSQMASLGFEIAHELSHVTELFLFHGERQKSHDTNLRSCLNEQKKNAYELYSSGGSDSWWKSYSRTTFMENRADWIGLTVAYRTWRKIASAAGGGIDHHDIDKFLVSYAQVWCSGSRDAISRDAIRRGAYPSNHALPPDRVNNPMQFMSNSIKRHLSSTICKQ